jgi:periplasmic divalent cation tolerance protein
MGNFVVALTTVPAGFDAAGMARTLVERGLAACVNILPGVTSVYRWQGAVECDAEVQIIMKTTADKIGALDQAVQALSPHDVPEFIVLPIVAGSEAYLAWLDEN